jgi:tRNA(His) guanylyltransferase
MTTLKDRINDYINISDFKLLNRVPIIININGRNFSRFTSLLEKPYCNKFAEAMLSITIKLCMEVEGALFAFHHNDEITIVTRNDQSIDTEPWYDNKVQKIASVTSSIATLYFSKYLSSNNLNVLGDALFTSTVFTVPNVAEAINTLICKQQQNFHTSMQFACFYELLKKYDKHLIKKMLTGLTIDEKSELLLQKCNINFNEYPDVFRLGAACYKVPKIITDNIIKTQWVINTQLPIFTKEHVFLNKILK